MDRIIPDPQYFANPKDPAVKRPKQTTILPRANCVVHPHGFYIFLTEVQSGLKQTLWLAFMVFLAFFFLLFRVWPEWLRLGVWYLSWYFLVFLIGCAIVRAIVWFLVWHIGVDFWIFPNYFIDSVSFIHLIF